VSPEHNSKSTLSHTKIAKILEMAKGLSVLEIELLIIKLEKLQTTPNTNRENIETINA